MPHQFQPGPLSAASAAALSRLARDVDRANRLTVAPPLAVSEAGGNKVISAALPGPVVFVRPTGTPTSGRYPGYVQVYDVAANTWSDITAAVWLVHPNGGQLPTQFNQSGTYLTTYRVPAVYAGVKASDGKAVYLALVVPGVELFWECVDSAPVYYFDPQV